VTVYRHSSLLCEKEHTTTEGTTEMSRKDYRAIAELFKIRHDRIIRSIGLAFADNTHKALLQLHADMVEDVADILQRDNSRFNRHTFYDACGVTDYE
jgi:hypothetical protein